MKTIPLYAAALFVFAACSNEKTDADYQKEALLGVKAYVATELEALHSAAAALQTAAPDPDADGWNPTSDSAAVATMKSEWKKARVAYERVEGAIAVLFPDLDVSTDERYDGFLADGPDTNLFDDQGVIGVHAIERILWADAHPSEVVTFESTVTGYEQARFPATEAEARDFKEKLAMRLMMDTMQMRDEFEPLALDVAAAYRGVQGSMEEQHEKVQLASTGESESRYAQHTLADMRANLAGGVAIYNEFQKWLESKSEGAMVDAEIDAKFATLAASYDAYSGDTLPPVPATWNPDDPSAEDLMSDYGKLWSTLGAESDPASAYSLVSAMNRGAALLGIPML